MWEIGIGALFVGLLLWLAYRGTRHKEKELESQQPNKYRRKNGDPS